MREVDMYKSVYVVFGRMKREYSDIIESEIVHICESEDLAENIAQEENEEAVRDIYYVQVFPLTY